MADFFDMKNPKNFFGGLNKPIPQLNEDINKNYEAAIRYYQAREQQFYTKIITSNTKNKGIEDITKQEFEDFSKSFLKYAQEEAEEDYNNFLKDARTKMINETYNSNRTITRPEKVEQIVNWSDISAHQEGEGPRIIKTAAEKALKENFTNALNKTINSGYQILVTGLDKTIEDGIRSKGMQIGGDNTILFNTKVTKDHKIGNVPLAKYIELNTGIDLLDYQDKNATNDLLTRVKNEMFNDNQKLFDQIYGTQQKSWTYDSSDGKKWMSSVTIKNHLQGIFNQVCEESTWVDEHALNYVAWDLSRYLLNIVGAINIFYVAGNQFAPMSQFLSEYIFYMKLSFRNRMVSKAIKKGERKEGTSSKARERKGFLIDDPGIYMKKRTNAEEKIGVFHIQKKTIDYTAIGNAIIDAHKTDKSLNKKTLQTKKGVQDYRSKHPKDKAAKLIFTWDIKES